MKTGSISRQRLPVVRFEVNTHTRGLQDIFHDCKVRAFTFMSPSSNFFVDFSSV